MSSPFWEGTHSASAFSSRDIDIQKEKIHLTIAHDFMTAFYVIEYFIKTDSAGKQIPLLFLAKDYKADFKVWVDNREIKLSGMPSGYLSTTNTGFEKFSNAFSSRSGKNDQEEVIIHWDKNSGALYKLNDLKYFETELSKGEHIIRVKYTAGVWKNFIDWITEYSFRYSLSPAKYWRLFGSLEVVLNTSAFKDPLTINFGQPTRVVPDSVSIWTFSKLPGDFLQITYLPKVGSLANALIFMGPTGLTVIIACIIGLLHFWHIKRYRQNNLAIKYSWVVIAGSLINSFLILLGFMISFEIIDGVIGAHAGKHHGYPFMVILLYPFLLPVYWIVMWLTDRALKRKIKIRNDGLA